MPMPKMMRSGRMSSRSRSKSSQRRYDGTLAPLTPMPCTLMPGMPFSSNTPVSVNSPGTESKRMQMESVKEGNSKV